MAPRQRFIWPTIWDDPDLGRLPEPAMLLYIACFSNADDDGRLLGDPTYLKSIAFRYRPVEDDTVLDLRAQLQKACKSFVVYDVDGTEYVAFANWDEFQKPKYPLPSKLPPPPGYKRSRRKPAPRKRIPSGTSSEPVPNHSGNGSTTGEGWVGQGRVGLGIKAVTSTTDLADLNGAANGLPFAQELLVSKLLAHIGSHADEHTPRVIRKYALHLPEATLAKVLESSEHAKPNDRAAYVVAALKDEREALG